MRERSAEVPVLERLRARRSEKWAVDQDVLPATVAEMDFELAPAVLAALRAAIDRHDLGYVPAVTPRLAQAFVGFAERRLGWDVDPQQLMLVTDVMVGIVTLCRSLIAPGGSVAFASPNYPPFFTELAGAGFRIATVGLRDDDSLDLDALKRILARGTRVFVLSSPHNPLGRVVPRAELEAVAAICAGHDAWVIADEIHAPLTLEGSEHTPWLAVSDATRRQGIAITSASKAFNLAALKCAIVVTASGRARDAVARIGPQTDHVGLLGVLAAEAAFEAGDEWLDAVLAALQTNRALLQERLLDMPGINWTPPGASYLAWLDCTKLGLGDEPAAAFLRHRRVALSPGSSYGESGRGYLRLNFGTSSGLVAEMLRRMQKTLERRQSLSRR